MNPNIENEITILVKRNTDINPKFKNDITTLGLKIPT